MLGGYARLSRLDLQGSANFVAKLRRLQRAQQHQKAATRDATAAADSDPDIDPDNRVARAVDCGAGIGRITRGLLARLARRIDVVEPVAKFTDALTAAWPADAGAELGAVVSQPLQDWRPAPGTYDLIWIQWCLGHLDDAQTSALLRRCGSALAERSQALIVVKENVAGADGGDVVDEGDASITHTEASFRRLFARAGLCVVLVDVQRGFPRELYAVKMFALRPAQPSSGSPSSGTSDHSIT